MTVISLQRNVQFLYEEHLARIELKAFGCNEYERDEDNPWEFKVHLNGNEPAIKAKAAYVGSVGGSPTVYHSLLLPAYQGGRFNRTRSVNQYLTHWIYPYQGKFHPQMVRALLNILKVREGSTVLDPFMGSGTTALEASLLGAHCLGVDPSPVCVLVTRVKTQAHTAVDLIRDRVGTLLESKSLEPDQVASIRETDQRVADFLEVARLVTCSDVARRGRDVASAFRKNLKNMLESVTAQAVAIEEHQIPASTPVVRQGDARDLSNAGIESGSVDAVVTSPPYSIALDYVKNDEHALVELGANLTALRGQMIGVRGQGTKQRHQLYNEDMQRSFAEISRVLKPGGGAAFVIGDATIDGTEVTTTSTMVDWAHDVGLNLERNIPKIVFGLYNVMRDEKILVFRKT